MSNDPSPLKYMGTQSHETMAMEAALAQRAVHSTEQGADQMLGELSDKIDATSGDIAAEGTKISDATNWAKTGRRTLCARPPDTPASGRR